MDISFKLVGQVLALAGAVGHQEAAKPSRDEALMVQVAGGDHQAADELVHRHQHSLFSFIYRLTMNQADTEDLFQETWLRVIRYRHTFNPDKKFTTWLFQIALNCVRDAFGKKGPAAVDIEGEIGTEARDAGLTAYEDQECVEKIMQKLSLSHREVIILRYFHDMKESEIAVVLGIPIGTVKSRLHHALGAAKNKCSK